MATIPDDYRDLLDRPVTVSLATILPNGQPQVTPVWVDYDGEHILVNTDATRQKFKDMQERPQVTVLAVDPNNSFRYLEVRGTAVRFEEEGGSEHIDKLAKKYTGADRYGNHLPDERRMICYIEPKKALPFG